MKQLELDITVSPIGKDSAKVRKQTSLPLNVNVGLKLVPSLDEQPPSPPTLLPGVEGKNDTSHENSSPGNTVCELRDVIRQKWPEAIFGNNFGESGRVRINLHELEALLPPDGIPYGQMIEITGGTCSGKTSVIMKALGAMIPRQRVLYVDSTESFFPPAAAAAGIDLGHLLVLKNRNLNETLRTVEILLEQKQIDCVVFDFAGFRTMLPRILLHRLRQQIARARALVFFVTDDNFRLLPASLISLQLTVTKVNRKTIEITTTRSRITNEGTKGRINLEAA